jgi:hypothetical protein
MTVDWALLKVQYEVFGASFLQLAEEQNIPLSRIEYAAEVGNWVQSPDPALPDKLDQLTTVPAELKDNLIAEIEDRLSIQQLLKTSSLSPKYVALEATILQKSLELAQSITPASQSAAKQLQQLTEVMNSLKEKNHILNKQNDGGSEDNSVKVSVITHVQSAPSGSPIKTAEVVDVDHRTIN